jgi:hypothetical protein
VLSTCALTRRKRSPASVTSCCCYSAWDVAHRQLPDTPCSVSKLAAAITPKEVKTTRFLFFLRLHPSSVAALTTGDDVNDAPPSKYLYYIFFFRSDAWLSHSTSSLQILLDSVICLQQHELLQHSVITPFTKKASGPTVAADCGGECLTSLLRPMLASAGHVAILLHLPCNLGQRNCSDRLFCLLSALFLNFLDCVVSAYITNFSWDIFTGHSRLIAFELMRLLPLIIFLSAVVKLPQEF